MSSTSASRWSSTIVPSLLAILGLCACVAGRIEGSQASPAERSPVPASTTVLARKRGANEEREEPKNHAALFLGVTDEDDSSSGAFGIEYERRLSTLIGLGILFESTPALEERLVTAPSFFLHPMGGLFVALSPGAVRQAGELRPLFRTAVGWEFELGERFTLAPELNYDLVSGADDALVYGVALGCSF